MCLEEWSLLPKTRAEAETVGSKHYFTDRPCKLGHICPRYQSNAHCLECSIGAARKQRAANPAKHREYKREYGRKWGAANREKQRESARKWRAANPEEYRESRRKWDAANSERRLECTHKWRAADPKKALLLDAKKRLRRQGVASSLLSPTLIGLKAATLKLRRTLQLKEPK